jgi:glycosyltransferase involved in cell wall biosynthesis
MDEPSTGGAAFLPPRDLSLERKLIANSGLFDEDEYLARASHEAQKDPLGHYLQVGWQLGLDPNASFPGTLLLPYFATMGIHEPPAITWLVLRSAGWPIPATWEEAESLAGEVRKTGLFDETFYAGQLARSAAALSPAIHYVIIGERLGMQPCVEFDPTYYGMRYPDVVQAGFNCLLHYAQHGRNEGRRGSPRRTGRKGLRIADPDKDNVILVVHETSRTGAPILGWNIASHLAQTHNIYTIQLGKGDLTAQFEALSVEMHGPFKGRYEHDIDVDELSHSLRNLAKLHRFSYAIINSAESRFAIEPLVRDFIPTLLLLHEFASYVHPTSSLSEAFNWSTEVIFPARIVALAAEEIHPVLRARRTHIMPQGMSLLPSSNASSLGQAPTADASRHILEKLTEKHDVNGTFVVLSAGFLHIRKGVDLFLAAAATVARSRPGRDIHFLWVGDGFRPESDMHYSVYLKEQLNRSGVSAHVTILSAVSDLEPVYRIADVFFLSSRLDPLPNVSIDAAVRGIPIICFRDASGMAELMLSNPTTAKGVVDHLDAEAAGQLILALAENEDLRRSMADATQSLTRTKFDMQNYVAQLNAVGTKASNQMTKRLIDAETLMNDSAFDQDMFLGSRQVVEPRKSTIARYLAVAAAGGWKEHAVSEAFRRPSPGFNPLIYFEENASRLPDGVDPLADYVRQGKPVGSWSTPVLRPLDDPSGMIPAGQLRVALHAHFFYPELAVDFLSHLQSNTARCDLLVSTNDAEKACQLQRVLALYRGGAVDIRVVSNRGRDIGPLLTGFSEELARYDLIGHVHGKRSLGIGNDTLGDRWREFLWQNLLGGMHPMLDRIVTAFEHDNRLGLVFPSDPHMNTWDGNRALAGELAARMGWSGPLPDYFDFPLGTMFWARKEALAPLLNLRLGWNDYPEEPLPYDGTILHALERLTPFACRLAGFTSAVTHIFGVSW